MGKAATEQDEMTPEKLKWFKCEHGKLLKTLITLQHEEAAVYIIIHLTAFDRREPCPDSIEALSRWTGLNRKRVMAARFSLLKSGKILSVDGGLITPEALDLLIDQEEAIQQIGVKKWKNSKGKTEQNQQMALLREEDKKDNVLLSENVSRARGPKYPKPVLVPLPPDWTPKPAAVSFAAEYGLTAADVDLIAVKMTATALGNGTLKENWDQHFRSWIVKEWEIRAREKARAEQRQHGSRGPSLADIAMGGMNGR